MTKLLSTINLNWSKSHLVLIVFGLVSLNHIIECLFPMSWIRRASNTTGTPSETVLRLLIFTIKYFSISSKVAGTYTRCPRSFSDMKYLLNLSLQIMRTTVTIDSLDATASSQTVNPILTNIYARKVKYTRRSLVGIYLHVISTKWHSIQRLVCQMKKHGGVYRCFCLFKKADETEITNGKGNWTWFLTNACNKYKKYRNNNIAYLLNSSPSFLQIPRYWNRVVYQLGYVLISQCWFESIPTNESPTSARWV